MGNSEYFLAIDGLLQYFHFIFNVYAILTCIVLINCIKAFFIYRALKKQEEDVSISGADLLVSLLCGFALFNGLLFQGVISDVSSYHSGIWSSRVFILCIIAFVLYLLQIFFTARGGRFDKNS